MKAIKYLALTAGLAALAGCADAEDADSNLDTNMVVEDNLALPADDMNMDMNVTNDTGNAVDNATDNMTDDAGNNSVNAY